LYGLVTGSRTVSIFDGFREPTVAGIIVRAVEAPTAAESAGAEYFDGLIGAFESPGIADAIRAGVQYCLADDSEESEVVMVDELIEAPVDGAADTG